MAEVTNELMFELLKRLQGDLSDLRHGQREIITELSALRTHTVAIQTHVANIYGRLGRLEDRAARIENRLDIVTETTG